MQSLFSQVTLHIEEVIGGGTKDETVEGEVLVSLFRVTRSYAALRAADLDWIVGQGYSSGGYILEKKH